MTLSNKQNALLALIDRAYAAQNEWIASLSDAERELVGTPEGDATITIAGGESAYVMNDTGRTVDTIKPALRTATAFRTGSQG